ncbi:MAG: CRISPR-associated endonuclease Cas1 [candidate division WS6 bacterium OLB20]|uniref:CRISPR-associated endonuclease Cas1 n=1 Tax=candidate division WS6 bacterium OLB20 TaxID=1617426 RepID=A0A136LXM9_9BACT|nr:MAG: CRISPR-associated endonuclease Cas1 [candidate division WS6 bacterium OLB20]
MAYRTVYITNPTHLHTRAGNMILSYADGNDVAVPLEDIATVIIEHPQVTLSAPFMSECMHNDVAVYFCNDQHLPHGIALPFQSHVRQRKRMQQQLAMKAVFKKRLWQLLVREKIRNQARVLKLLGSSGADQLMMTAARVKSGDAGNLESYAARFYFQRLFPEGFARFADDTTNAALNYGYAVIRGAIARSLAAYGFIPSIGIHHKNEYNNFNLADDLIEPFRPVVDLVVASHPELDETLNPAVKASLVRSLGIQVTQDDKRMSTQNAIEEMVKSLVTAVENNSPGSLKLPVIVAQKQHTYA